MLLLTNAKTVARHKPNLEPTKDTQYLALRASYGTSVERVWEKNDRVVTAPHCTLYVYQDFQQKNREVSAYLSHLYHYTT